MRWLYKISLRFRSLFRRNRVEQELTDEFRFHFEKQIETHVAQGMPPAEAHRTALRELGGLEQHMEECRDRRPGRYGRARTATPEGTPGL